jgi:hypothetical protein
LSSIKEDIKEILDLDRIIQEFQERLSFLSGEKPGFINTLKKVFSENSFVEKLIPICLVENFETMVTYPATYEFKGSLRATGGILLFYSKNLSYEEIEWEYEKVNIISRNSVMRNLEYESSAIANSVLAQSFGHEVRAVNTLTKNISDFFADHKDIGNSKEYLKILQRFASEYLDFWATSDLKEQVIENTRLDDIIFPSKYIALIKSRPDMTVEKYIKNIDAIKHLLFAEIVVHHINASSIRTKSFFKKALIAGLSNAIMHIIKDRKSNIFSEFKEGLSKNNIFIIIDDSIDGSGKEEISFNIYNQGKYVPVKSSISTREVMRIQMRDKGNAFMTTVNSDKDINKIDLEKIKNICLEQDIVLKYPMVCTSIIWSNVSESLSNQISGDFK